MPKEDNERLKCNHREKSMKLKFIIYAELENLLEKTNTCHNNPEKSSTTKINKNRTSGYSLFTYWSFDATKTKLDYYRGRDSMKNFCKDLNEHAIKVINKSNKNKLYH